MAMNRQGAVVEMGEDEFKKFVKSGAEVKYLDYVNATATQEVIGHYGCLTGYVNDRRVASPPPGGALPVLELAPKNINVQAAREWFGY